MQGAKAKEGGMGKCAGRRARRKQQCAGQAWRVVCLGE